MTKITALEDFRMTVDGIVLVHVNFTADTGETYERYVKAADWDKDPTPAMTDVFNCMQSRSDPAPVKTPTSHPTPIQFTPAPPAQQVLS